MEVRSTPFFCSRSAPATGLRSGLPSPPSAINLRNCFSSELRIEIDISNLIFALNGGAFNSILLQQISSSYRVEVRLTFTSIRDQLAKLLLQRIDDRDRYQQSHLCVEWRCVQ